MLYIALLIILSFMVTWTKNVFMSLMYSVMLYINATCVLLMLGFEFLALINILIYVGALAVLFLFVIMLIEVPTTELRAYYRGSSVLGLLSYVGVVGLFNVRHDWQGSMTCGADVTGADVTGADVTGTGTGGAGYILCPTQESIMQIGYAFYIQYADILILNSLVLTIALFGALVLAHTRS